MKNNNIKMIVWEVGWANSCKAVNKIFILSDVSTARDKKVINDVLTKISTVR